MFLFLLWLILRPRLWPMALDTSVIKESRTPDAACPSLLDVSALDSPVSPALSHEVSSDWGRPFLRLSNGAGKMSIYLDLVL